MPAKWFESHKIARILSFFTLGILLPAIFLSYLGFRSFHYENLVLKQQLEGHYAAVADATQKKFNQSLEDLIEALRNIVSTAAFQRSDLPQMAITILSTSRLAGENVESVFVYGDQDQPIVPSLSTVHSNYDNDLRADVDWGNYAPEIERLKRLEFVQKDIPQAIAGYANLRRRMLSPLQQASLLKTLAIDYRKVNDIRGAETSYQELIQNYETLGDIMPSNFRRSLLILSLLSPWQFALAAPGVSLASLEQIYHQGLVKETGERDLEGAIQIFQRVAAHRAEAPELGAKAQLRIGFCYERLDQPEQAIQAYQEVLTQVTSAPPEIAQTAQSNLERLQTRLEKERVVKIPPAPEPALAERKSLWDLSFEFGYGFHKRPSDMLFPHFITEEGDFHAAPDATSFHLPTFWGAIGYHANSWLSVGLEGGYLFATTLSQVNAVTDPYNGPSLLTRTATSSQSYVGLQVQATGEQKRFREYVRLGFGICDVQDTLNSAEQYSGGGGLDTGGPLENALRPATPLAIGADYKFTPWFSLGLGLRDLMIFHSTLGINYTTYQLEDYVQVEHELMSFLRTTFYY